MSTRLNNCGMLSERCWKFLGSIWYYASLLGSIPYSWDRRYRHVVRSSHSHVLVRFHLYHISLYLIFLVLQCIRFRAIHDYQNFNLTYSSFLAIVLVVFAFALTIFKESDCVTVGNSLVLYIKVMQPAYHPNFNPNTHPYNKLVDFGLLVIAADYASAVILGCLAYTMFPRSPISLCNIIPDDAPLIVELPVCYVIPRFYIVVISANGFSLIATFYGYGMYIVRFAVIEFRLGLTSYMSDARLRNPNDLIVAYRGVQVLHSLVNDLVAPFLFPTQAFITKLVIFSLFMVIKYGKDMDGITYALMLCLGAGAGIFWSGILLMGGCLNFYGNKVLMSWKVHNWGSKREAKIMAKFRKSCKPFQLSWGKAYVIKRLSVLKFVRSLSRGTLRALLTLK